jgi:hypothetical protein
MAIGSLLSGAGRTSPKTSLGSATSPSGHFLPSLTPEWMSLVSPTMRTMSGGRKKAEEVQRQTIMRKALLGDDEAKRLSEEQGPLVAQAYAKKAARDLDLCDCARTDGIVCGRRLTLRAGFKCWPCFARSRDDKPCDHARNPASRRIINTKEV